MSDWVVRNAERGSWPDGCSARFKHLSSVLPAMVMTRVCMTVDHRFLRAMPAETRATATTGLRFRPCIRSGYDPRSREFYVDCVRDGRLQSLSPGGSLDGEFNIVQAADSLFEDYAAWTIRVHRDHGDHDDHDDAELGDCAEPNEDDNDDGGVDRGEHLDRGRGHDEYDHARDESPGDDDPHHDDESPHEGGP